MMRYQKWIGISPSNIYRGANDHTLFFNWDPTGAGADALYYITLTNRAPKKATLDMQRCIPSQNSLVYNHSRTAYAFTKDGNVFYRDEKTKRERRITQTIETSTILFGDSWYLILYYFLFVP